MEYDFKVTIDNINEEIFYHINTGKKLEIGDVLEIGDKYNNFYHQIYNMESLDGNNDANQILLEMKKNNCLIFKNGDNAKIVSDTVSNSAMITRELMFEEVRKEINHELPSRLKCLYVCKTKDEIKSWLEIFKRTDKKDYQILKLKLTGKIFKGDASYVLRQNISLNKKKEQARLYWNGIHKDNIYEYLFEGKLVVEDILDNEFV